VLAGAPSGQKAGQRPELSVPPIRSGQVRRAHAHGSTLASPLVSPDSTGLRRFDIAHTSSADHPVPCGRILMVLLVQLRHYECK
jgi:hypothetical protein